jgi:hypothetical protein
VLRTVCEAECVTPPAQVCGEDLVRLRRELLSVMERLRIANGHKREPQNDREVLERIRAALPVDDTSLALIYTIRALESSHLPEALEEIQHACRWAGRAVLSPL